MATVDRQSAGTSEQGKATCLYRLPAVTVSVLNLEVGML
jgi:hypothetical protein